MQKRVAVICLQIHAFLLFCFSRDFLPEISPENRFGPAASGGRRFLDCSREQADPRRSRRPALDPTLCNGRYRGRRELFAAALKEIRELGGHADIPHHDHLHRVNAQRLEQRIAATRQRRSGLARLTG